MSGAKGKMKSIRKEQIHYLNLIDLSKTDKKGAFNCPVCGSNISPSDTSEKTYSILEAKINALGLGELVVCCKKCGSQIYLTGITSNTNLLQTSEKITSDENYYVTHI